MQLIGKPLDYFGILATITYKYIVFHSKFILMTQS